MDPMAALGPLSAELTMEQASILMADVKQVRKQCIRNGFLMPPEDDAICTGAFVRGVKDRTFWMLETSSATAPKMIADPPSRKHVAQVLHHKMVSADSQGEEWDTQVRNTAEAILKHPPQLWWMELVLTVVDPDNDMFHPMWMPPQPEPKIQTFTVPNPNGFFSSQNLNPALLQQLIRSSKKRKRGMNLFSAQEKHQQKMRNMQSQMAKLQDQMVKEQHREHQRQSASQHSNPLSSLNNNSHAHYQPQPQMQS